MSGIFRKSQYTESQALVYFIQNSITSVLFIESQYAFVLLLNLNPNIESPYSKIFFDESNGISSIKSEDVTQLVLKFVPIVETFKPQGINTDPFTEKFFFFYEKGKMFMGSRRNDLFIKKVAVQEDQYNREVELQKLAFYTTYMLDFQMKAITPNILLSFFVNIFNYAKFIPLFTFLNEERKYIVNHDESDLKIYSKKKHEYLFIQFMKSIFEKKYKLGCVLMEYLPDSKNFIDIECVDNRRNKDLGKKCEYIDFLKYKADVLIAIDKCMFVGINHNDLHLSNVMTYLNNDKRTRSATIIDFGLSNRIMENSEFDFNCSRNDRKRKFNDLIIVEDVYMRPTKATSTRYASDTLYLLNCIIKKNTKYEDILNLSQTGYTKEPVKGLEMWNDITMKNPNFLDPKHPNQPIFQSAFKYVPVQIMNDLDKQMVQFGIKVRDFLLKATGEENEIKHYIDEDNKISNLTSYQKNGGITLLNNYISKHGLDENCKRILERNEFECIEIFNILPSSSIIAEKERHKTMRILNICLEEECNCDNFVKEEGLHLGQEICNNCKHTIINHSPYEGNSEIEKINAEIEDDLINLKELVKLPSESRSSIGLSSDADVMTKPSNCRGNEGRCKCTKFESPEQGGAAQELCRKCGHSESDHLPYTDNPNVLQSDTETLTSSDKPRGGGSNKTRRKTNKKKKKTNNSTKNKSKKKTNKSKNK